MIPDRLIDGNVRYLRSTEVPQAAYAGLAPQGHEAVVSVLGSGDVAFLLASSARHVRGFDIAPEQVDIARERARLLVDGDQEAFLGPTYRASRAIDDPHNPLTKKDLVRMRWGLGRITYETADWFRDAGRLVEGSDKVYLSNVLGKGTADEAVESVAQAGSLMAPGSLLYLSTSALVPRIVSETPWMLREDLSAKALSEELRNRVYRFHPAVLERRA